MMLKTPAKWVRCKLKNIAVNLSEGIVYYTKNDLKTNPHIEFTNHLPDNCIRLNNKSKSCDGMFKHWCDFCQECR